MIYYICQYLLASFLGPKKLVPLMLMPLKRLLSWPLIAFLFSFNTLLTCTRVFGLKSCHGFPLVTYLTAFMGYICGSKLNRVCCLDWVVTAASFMPSPTLSTSLEQDRSFYDLLIDNYWIEAVKLFSLSFLLN